MNNALFGFLIIFIPLHVLLILIPITHTLRAAISAKSKILWCGFLLFLPLIGVAFFHFKYRTSLFQGKVHEVSAAEERARSGTLAPRDHD
ncbi:MAG: hypothetical protein HKN34_03195 [Gammaproteobacteria bacterium]|nr:hypothetical protein [Gammaproteobacteria bacterium]